MHKFTALLVTVCLFLIGYSTVVTAAPSTNKERSFSYEAPTTRTDLTVLSIDEIDHFDLYCGNATGVYNAVPVATALNTDTTMTAILPIEVTYCAVTATDTDSVESLYSNEVSPTMPPGAPRNLITITVMIGG